MSGAKRRRCRAFLTWLRDARAEVKRDMEIRRDEVRVMTVHGAKGLEAPVVILADTMTPPAGPRPPRLLQLADGATIWVGRKADDVPKRCRGARRCAHAEAEHEYRRLLYVAMTRAADRLIVCGADGMNGAAERLLVRADLATRSIRCSSTKGRGEESLLYRGRARTTALAPAQTADAGGDGEAA